MIFERDPLLVTAGILFLIIMYSHVGDHGSWNTYLFTLGVQLTVLVSTKKQPFNFMRLAWATPEGTKKLNSVIGISTYMMFCMALASMDYFHFSSGALMLTGTYIYVWQVYEVIAFVNKKFYPYGINTEGELYEKVATEPV